MKRLVGVISGLDSYESELVALSRESNEVLLGYVETSARAFAAGDEGPLRGETLRPERARLGDALLVLRNRFVARNEDALLGAVAASDAIKGPVLAPQIF